jgi:Tol biopolymer transport system component
VELPYTIVFEPPSRSELRALLRMRGHWAAGLIVALTIGAIYILATVARADAGVAVAVAPLTLGSRPPGASVWVDGQQRGLTPLALTVEPGVHRVLLKRRDALDRQYSLDVGVSGVNIDTLLWRQQPLLTHLRATLPGAILTDVRLLDYGWLGLTIELPPGRDLEAWRLDPASGAVEAVLSGVSGARLTFAADGQHLAYLGSAVGPRASPAYAGYGTDGTPLDVVWLVSAAGDAAPGGATVGWRAPLESTEQLADVSWSPNAEGLLAVATEPLAGGGARSRLWLVAADGHSAAQVLSIPSQVVPGTLSWSPDGQHAAFVAHAASLNALCLLGTDGSFRYVADLDPSTAQPLGYPLVSWSADSRRMLFVAPHQHPPGVAFDWLTPDTRHSLYEATLEQPTPIGLTDTQVEQVTWREDGQLLAVWRATSDGPLRVRLMNSSGGDGQDLLELPFQPGSAYAAAWDLARANVLVASRTSTGATDYWLARLAAEASP